MKRSLKMLPGAMVLVFALLFSAVKPTNGNARLTQQNITMLSASAEVAELEVDPGGGTLTGPRETIDCKGIGTGNKEVCKCENSVSCTDSACY